MAPALALEITGLANGAPVEVVGSGEIDAGRLRLEVRTLRANLAFDPALVAVGLLDVLAIVWNALGATYVRSRTDLYDEHGREAGGWRVVAALTSTVRLAGLLVDHRTHMEPGELIRSVEPWTVLAQPLDPEGVLLAGAWQAQTGRGNGYRGVSRLGDRWKRGAARRGDTAGDRVGPGPSATGRDGMTVDADVSAATLVCAPPRSTRVLGPGTGTIGRSQPALPLCRNHGIASRAESPPFETGTPVRPTPGVLP